MSALWQWWQHLSYSHAAAALLVPATIAALVYACYQDLKHGGRP